MKKGMLTSPPPTSIITRDILISPTEPAASLSIHVHTIHPRKLTGDEEVGSLLGYLA